VAQCKSLQNSKTVGSNPTLCSKQFRGSIMAVRRSPKPLVGVRFPPSEPNTTGGSPSWLRHRILIPTCIGSNPIPPAKFALLFQRLEFRFCNPAMRVRVLHRAPNNGDCSIMVVPQIVILYSVSSTLISHPI
jgi:hypothetical protein